MTDKIKETDKAVLKRIMSEPTFEAVRQAAIRENAKRIAACGLKQPVSVQRPAITVRSRTESEQNAGETGNEHE